MSMSELIDPRRDDVARLCQAHGVRRLDVFGSAASEHFDPENSDIDFIVDFGPAAQQQLFHHYFALKQALEALFARPVDLVMAGAMRNPYFIDAAMRTRQPVYASTLAKAA